MADIFKDTQNGFVIPKHRREEVYRELKKTPFRRVCSAEICACMGCVNMLGITQDELDWFTRVFESTKEENLIMVADNLETVDDFEDWLKESIEKAGKNG